MSLEAIGLSSWLTLPWGLKFLWAPVVDRIGSQRAWILALQTAGVLLCLGLAMLDLQDLLFYAGVTAFFLVLNALAVERRRWS